MNRHPSPLEKCLLQELARSASVCTERGWCDGTAGNFSIQHFPGRSWFSPSGAAKGMLHWKDFVLVDDEHSEIDLLRNRKPSGEYPIHLGIYRRVRWAKAIVHAHSPGIVKASKGKKSLRLTNDEMIKHLGAYEHSELVEIPVLANPLRQDLLKQIQDLGSSIVEDKIPLVILEGHGAYAWGKSPFEALCFLESAEFLCKNL